jgi:hypothetical protein
MPRKITPATSIDNLKKEAKRWLSALRAQDPDARARLERVSPGAPSSSEREPVLRDVQHALAREHGLESWIALKEALANAATSSPAPWSTLSADGYEQLARDFVLALDSRDEAALLRLNAHYERAFTFDDLWAEIWRRVYAFRQRSSRVPKNYLHIDEARMLIAQDSGFGSWSKLTEAVTIGAPRVPPYATEEGDGESGGSSDSDGGNGDRGRDSRIAPRRQLNRSEWDELIALMKERRITRLDAGGLMTDELMARVAELPHVTALSLGGSRQLTDDGLLLLARMPQLESLDLSEYPGGRLTDRGLAVFAHLPNLRRLEMTWQRGITDAGVAHLRACDALEQVNLMGTPTGDGGLEALQGKPRLRRIASGRLVTDDGLRHLRNFPLLQTCDGAEQAAKADPDDDAAHERFRNAGARLLIDGPFTDAGLASLSGLAGIVDLDLFWHVTAMTSAGFAHLRELPNLVALGADGKLSDNDAMRHFAAIPRLRSLRCQEAEATDEGFEALSRSATLARLWGRECAHFGSRGFVALSKMPALRTLGIGCANVDDAALSTLPRFQSLRELTPIGVKDDGFRHIGKCERLTRLTCMYCRDTTDAATEHVAGLNLTYYYAGLTLITDRSLEIFGRMTSLEQFELYECNHVTDAGLVFLAPLPRLREVHLDSLPGVTLEGTRVFPARVRVRYTT